MEKKFQHLLIVFGGLKGLEIAVESDENLSDVQDPADLFDLYLNTCPDQVFTVFFLPPGPIDYAKHVIQGSQEGFAG